VAFFRNTRTSLPNLIGISAQGTLVPASPPKRRGSTFFSTKPNDGASPDKKKGGRFENVFTSELVENTSHRLNLMLSDKKARKIDDMKHRIVDYEPSDMEKKTLAQVLLKERQGKRRELESKPQQAEEKDRKSLHLEW
jgi:hypothetical protein